MSLKDRIHNVFEELKSILHEIAGDAAEVAPAAEAVEAVVAPETVAETAAAATVAEEVSKVTE
jgi:hypothetical protein